jgi:ribonuclease VapC
MPTSSEIAVDTSALAQIYLREQGYQRTLARYSSALARLLPVSCHTEFSLLSRLGDDRHDWLKTQVEAGMLAIAELPIEMATIAAEAARRYGKGSGHPAQLNFGDCLSYGFATYRDLPLLFVGDNFRHTDVTPAI